MYTSWAHGSLGGSFASGFAESLGLMEFKGFRVYILRPEDIVPGYMDPIRVSSKKRHQHRKGGGKGTAGRLGDLDCYLGTAAFRV